MHFVTASSKKELLNQRQPQTVAVLGQSNALDSDRIHILIDSLFYSPLIFHEF